MKISGFCASFVLLAPLHGLPMRAAEPVRIANPVGGHIHPAVCLSKQGTLIVTYGHVNHRDLRITRSQDGGKTWTSPTPFIHTVGKNITLQRWN